MHMLTRSRVFLLLAITVFLPAAPLKAENDLTLALADDSRCVQHGDTVTVLLRVSYIAQMINAVQAVIQYEPDVLSFVSISCGDGFGSPWDSAFPVFESVSGGEILYALGLLASGSDEDAVVATVEFEVLANGVSEMELLSAATTDPSIETKLTVYPTGGGIFPELGPPVGFVSSDIEYGDSNGDGSVDLHDYSDFQACLSGPNEGESMVVYSPDLAPVCVCLDADGDDDVDLKDFARFQLAFAGGPT
jgi:hypothetical protein